MYVFCYFMNISLTTQLEAYINQLIASGMYSSASEVVREAMRLFVQKKAAEDETFRLQLEIEKGLNSGEPKPMESFDEIIKYAQQRHS